MISNKKISTSQINKGLVLYKKMGYNASETKAPG